MSSAFVIRPNPLAICVENGALFTIGYQSRTVETYLDTIRNARITLLCDIRRNPISRKRGFSKRALLAKCDEMGISYVHLPALGISSSRRQELKVQKDYDMLFSEYREHYLPKLSGEIIRILEWLKSGHSVALTCFELTHTQCHRHCVAEAIEKQYPHMRIHHL